MSKVLHFGASGNAGRMIAAELKNRDYELTVVVRSEQKAALLRDCASHHIVADVANRSSLQNICDGFDIVISSLGKSVSPNDKSKPSFRDIDFQSNSWILEEALHSKVKKFVYLSVFHAEKYPNLEYFKTHFDFEQKLIASGIDYSIVRPPAIFSSFIDLMDMARKGRLMTIGKGDRCTNPIYEGDLAAICVDAIHQSNIIIEAGGNEIFSRKQINELIQAKIAPGKKLRSVPAGLIKAFLPLIKLFDRNNYDKFAFFMAVMEEDIIAPRKGQKKLEDYIVERGMNIGKNPAVQTSRPPRLPRLR